MGKAFGIVVIAVGVWAGLEIYTEGTSNAFGGALQKIGMAEPAPEGTEADKPLDALRMGVGDDMNVAEEKRKRAMGE